MKLKRWHLILIGVIIAIILCIVVLVQIFKETNCLAGWLFDFLGDWSTVLSATATLLLAGAAFWAIWQNYKFREEDRELNFKLRLLDEVRDWAREAVKLGLLYERARLSLKARSVFEDMIEDVSKTTDIADMAAKIFRNELKAPVEKAMSFVKSYKDPSKFASKEYFDSLFDLLKAINEAKRRLLKLEKQSPPIK